MAELSILTKLSTFSRRKTLCVAAAVAMLIMFPILWSSTDYWSGRQALINTGREARTFYDDPEVGYTIDKPMVNWDAKRRDWLEHYPAFASINGPNGVLVVTGSQPGPCPNPAGDHLLLRFFKNKVDYCRIHGYQIFYNNAFLQPKMRSYWAKGPILRAAMVAHPEAEWLFWVDADAVFTDMEFKIPFERYKDHNLVVYGWPERIFEDKSWVSLNAGVFLLRNCQWSMDFLDAWASMGPKSPNHSKWGEILKSTLSDMRWPIADDQSALVYLLLKAEKKWRDMTYVENQYRLSGYWLNIVDNYDDIAKKYVEIEKGVQQLRRRRAEAVRERYASEWDAYLAENGRWRRPFVTHFTGCAPCTGEPNPTFEKGSCRVGIEKALNIGDNQVLRSYGFVHKEINGSDIRPLPFDYSFGRR